MRISFAFVLAFRIGAGSRWTRVPSLAPQAIIGAFLIVAMSAGYVSADHLLKRISSPSVTVSASTGIAAELGTRGKHMLVSVGSGSNADDPDTHPNEFHRADVLEYTPEGKFVEVYAYGIRNCVGEAINSVTDQLWCSTNERDALLCGLPVQL